MTETMCAIGFRRYGPPEVLEQLVLARPTLAPGAILVRVAAAGINPADWNLRSGSLRLAVRLKLPFVLGADVAGIIEAVGEGVTQFQPGDAVYAMLPTSEGGGYAEYAALDAAIAMRVPANLGLTEAAAVPLAGITALQALRYQAAIQPGEQVLVNGASGGVGTFAVQIAKLLGAHVTAVCSGRNIDLVRDLGADDVRDYTRDDIFASETRYNAIFDTIGSQPFRRWRRLLQMRGTVVTIAPKPRDLAISLLTRLSRQRLKVFFVRPSGSDLEALSGWIADGRLRPVVDRSYALADAVDAHRYSESKRVRGKLVLVVDEQLAAQQPACTARAILTPIA
ncbi:MAG: NAD(P)-dependent alcohol dehydrogenase [Chloroflexales bacterium]|nr:NAD(P)-dependent alcohol dehydrogenase [Chloroflexales bacterium]